jgi:predicted nucleotidyltransferase
MTREDVIATLRAHEAALKKQKVVHAALFGSLARGEAGPDSDIDIMVELDEEALPTLWDYAGICTYIEELFPIKVDVAQRAGLRAHVRPSAERDAIYAF